MKLVHSEAEPCRQRSSLSSGLALAAIRLKENPEGVLSAGSYFRMPMPNTQHERSTDEPSTPLCYLVVELIAREPAVPQFLGGRGKFRRVPEKQSAICWARPTPPPSEISLRWVGRANTDFSVEGFGNIPYEPRFPPRRGDPFFLKSLPPGGNPRCPGKFVFQILHHHPGRGF